LHSRYFTLQFLLSNFRDRHWRLSARAGSPRRRTACRTAPLMPMRCRRASTASSASELISEVFPPFHLFVGSSARPFCRFSDSCAADAGEMPPRERCGLKRLPVFAPHTQIYGIHYPPKLPGGPDRPKLSGENFLRVITNGVIFLPMWWAKHHSL